MSKARLACVAVLLVIPHLSFSQSNVVEVDFDDLTAPCLFSSAQPLRSEYESRGIRFTGFPTVDDGAAALGDCSGYGVSGYSPPNFAVIDKQAILASGGVANRLIFHVAGEAPEAVSLDVGGTAGSTVFLSCDLCPWAVPYCGVSASTVLGTEMVRLEVSTAGAATDYLTCEVGSPDLEGWWIADNLEIRYAAQDRAIPTLSFEGAVMLAALLALWGVFAVSRGTGV